MAFTLSKLNAPLLAVIMGAMVLCAGAQSSDRAIIFSTPKTDDAQPAAAPPSSSQNSQLLVLPGSLRAPNPAFDFSVPSDLPAVPTTANTARDQRMKKMLDDRKNWMLMTPAEIFGVPPSEDLLRPPERDAMGREKTQTQMERYLERENEQRGGGTNGWQNDRDDSPLNLSRDRDGKNPFDPEHDGSADSAQRLNQFLNSRQGDDASQNRKEKNYGWDSVNPPAPETTGKPDVEQMAAMERFRQLLEPGSDSESEPSPDSRYFPVPKSGSALDPNFTHPDFVPNPAGASFTPLSSSIGRPAGLTPLPGIVTPTAKRVVVPAWSLQPPPWLSQGPQPFVMPQRKF
jgi:hypothetical protein